MRLIDSDAIKWHTQLSAMGNGRYEYVHIAYETEVDAIPTIEPETYKEKLNEIAGALSEKFAYMNTCLNERDIILGYLGVKLPRETHCNTNCTNTKCESHPSFAQPKPCEDAVHAAYKHGKSKGIKKGLGMLKDAQPETCEGCKHLGKWEDEVEYGYPSPCTLCKRRVEDHYER